jgi:radical SAM protein with 4Fe4S-binding SPASM domain
MCYQSDESFTKDQNLMGMMNIDLFKKIIDEISSSGTKAITLASRGEPTLHPHLGEMLEYCSGKFLEIKVNTNATKLTEKLIHKILKSEITDIVFSIDSYTKENYEQIRLKAIFEEVLNNIKKFKEIKEEFYPNSKIATRVSGVQVDEKQDPELFKNFWEKHVDHVVMVPMSPWWDTYNNSTDIAGKDTCGFLWQRMNIWYDGKCNPCDTDYKSTLSVGDFNNNSIKEIWHSKKYTEIRNAHLTKNRQNCFPCDRCPFEN